MKLINNLQCIQTKHYLQGSKKRRKPLSLIGHFICGVTTHPQTYKTYIKSQAALSSSKFYFKFIDPIRVSLSNCTKAWEELALGSCYTKNTTMNLN